MNVVGRCARDLCQLRRRQNLEIDFLLRFLSDEKAMTNLIYSTGLAWPLKFESSQRRSAYGKKELICRSHFGDVQRLHAMGGCSGAETPSDTKQKILRWMATMHNAATGVLDANTTSWHRVRGLKAPSTTAARTIQSRSFSVRKKKKQ